MTRASPPVVLQQMVPQDLGPSPDDPTVLAVIIKQASAVEGSVLEATIDRVDGRHDGDVTVTYTWTSDDGSADLVAPLTNTVTISANVLSYAIPMATVNRAGAQGDREVRVTLSNPANASLSPSNSFAAVILQDSTTQFPVIGAFTVSSATAKEGETLNAAIRRVSGDPSITVLVSWEWQSTGGDSDFGIGADFDGVATIDATHFEVAISIPTAVRSGTQGDRTVSLIISEVSIGQISTVNPRANFTLQDEITSTLPQIGVFPFTSDSIIEGQTITMMVSRLSSATQAVTFNYAFTSSLGSFDLLTPTSGTATLPLSAASVQITCATRDRSADVQGTRIVTCTISNPTIGSITQPIATNSLIDAPIIPDGGLPKLQPASVINDPTKSHFVGFTISGVTPKASYQTGRAGFAAAVAASNLAAGDVIILADGTYSGSKITFTKNGTATADGSKHIMVRARNHGKAVINLQLDINASYVWITGCKLPFFNSGGGTNYKSDGNSVLIRKNGAWVTNCQCTSASFVRIFDASPAITNIRICYNDLLCNCPATYTDMAVISMFQFSNNQYAPRDSDIAWNKMTYGPASTAIVDGQPASRNFCNLQDSKPNAGATPPYGATQDFRWHHNHMKGNVSEMVYFKRSVTFEYNYCEWLTAPGDNDITMRHGIIESTGSYGSGAIIRGNRLKSSGGVSIEINGSGIIVNGNVLDGSGDILVFAGNGTLQPQHDACDYAQLVENTGFGTVVMGSISGGHSVGTENVTGRNGWPSNVRLYRGDSTWTPTVSRDIDSNGTQCPLGNLSSLTGYGTGNAAKTTAITEAVLLAGCGCDPMT